MKKADRQMVDGRKQIRRTKQLFRQMSFILHTESFLRFAYFRCEWRWYRDQDTGA